MTIICGQCNDAIITKLSVRTNYAANCNAGNLINNLQRLKVLYAVKAMMAG